MNPKDSQKIDYPFIRSLGLVLKYAMEQASLDNLLDTLSLSDMNTSDGTSGTRNMLAQVLEDADRPEEGALLRSRQPVYVANGKVKSRIVSPQIERAMVDGYLKALLRLSTDRNGVPLDKKYAPKDVDGYTRSEAAKRAIMWSNEAFPHIRNLEGLDPSQVASLVAHTSNQTGIDFGTSDLMAHLKKPVRVALSKLAEGMGRYKLKLDARNRLVRDDTDE